MTSEEAQFLRVYIGHTRLVVLILEKLAHKLIERGASHDLSKLFPDEFDEFVTVNRVAREFKYGSEEYRQTIEETPAIHLHFSRNPHHPEHHADGIDGMSLLDIVEMVADWKAAAMMYGHTPLRESVEIAKERFGMSEKQAWLVDMIVDVLEE